MTQYFLIFALLLATPAQAEASCERSPKKAESVHKKEKVSLAQANKKKDV